MRRGGGLRSARGAGGGAGAAAAGVWVVQGTGCGEGGSCTHARVHTHGGATIPDPLPAHCVLPSQVLLQLECAAVHLLAQQQQDVLSPHIHAGPCQEVEGPTGLWPTHPPLPASSAPWPVPPAPLSTRGGDSEVGSVCSTVSYRFKVRPPCWYTHALENHAPCHMAHVQPLQPACCLLLLLLQRATHSSLVQDVETGPAQDGHPQQHDATTTAEPESSSSSVPLRAQVPGRSTFGVGPRLKRLLASLLGGPRSSGGDGSGDVEAGAHSAPPVDSSGKAAHFRPLTTWRPLQSVATTPVVRATAGAVDRAWQFCAQHTRVAPPGARMGIVAYLMMLHIMSWLALVWRHC